MSDWCYKVSEGVKDHLARYDFASEFLKGLIVLDVACGPGYGSALLLDRGAKKVFGCDISEDKINNARKEFTHPGAAFIIGDATCLPFEESSFDAVVSMETIEHLVNYKSYLKECRRVLKNNGIFICSTPYRGYGISGIDKIFPEHVHEFTIDELRTVISNYFAEITTYGQGRWRKGERAIWGLKYKIELKFKFMSIVFKYMYYNLFRRVKYNDPTTTFKTIDFKNISFEKNRPFLIEKESIIPKDIILIAKKIS